ncbi:hypothetical protein LITTLEE_223 [Mycobacterium phage LittleE]|uniref:Uncharacterized protein n=1 Tax=Mycobacterium phage LittleE TaxID=2922212 RepID=G1D4A7_9CAUD|nr:hypothetical protein FGG27_gp197 [Mycobacterium phage LittleE]AEK09613.1 hypothetical protein LITTLEE_223 [Mycobacterium phage LittleE]
MAGVLQGCGREVNNGARILRPEDDRAAMSGRLFLRFPKSFERLFEPAPAISWDIRY